jgi:hypothetical protein
VNFTNTTRKEKTMRATLMTKIRQNVRMGMLAALAFLCLLAPRLAAAAQEVVNVQFEGTAAPNASATHSRATSAASGSAPVGSARPPTPDGTA